MAIIFGVKNVPFLDSFFLGSILTLALVALSRVWQLNLRGLSAVVDMFNTPAKGKTLFIY